MLSDEEREMRRQFQLEHDELRRNTALQPRLRIYLEDVDRATADRLAACLEGFEVVHPRNSGDGPYSRVLLKSVAFESQETFEAECGRIAGFLATLTERWHLLGMYDCGTTSYHMELPNSGTIRAISSSHK